MKKFKVLFVFVFLPYLVTFGWGDKGHKTITQQAMKLLPLEMNLPQSIKNLVVDHCVDPDYRKKDDPTEGPKHFIDIDYYQEFMSGRMIEDKAELIKAYGDSLVEKQGVLPWATEDSYNKLIDAFKSRDKNKIVLYAADLAHYVEDAYQPLHTTMNYDGQLTGQKGVHARYEIHMVDDNLDSIKSHLDILNIRPIPNVRNFIFGYINDSNTLVDLILSADKMAFKNGNAKFGENYYKILWDRTGYITIQQFNNAARTLASFIYQAWEKAGKPNLTNL